MRKILLLFVLLCMGIPVLAQALKAGYTVDKVAVCSSQSAVQFTDQSTGSVISWKWNFGDGTTSTAQNPSHTFAKNGRYVVYLVVADATGKTDTAWASAQKDAVYVLPILSTPSWYLMTKDQSVAILKDSSYANQFLEYPPTYQWSTGETTSAISVNNDGKYTVSLTQCGQTVSKDIQVKKLESSLIMFPIDSGGFLSYAPDSAYVAWDVNNPFPKETYSKLTADVGDAWFKDWLYYNFGFQSRVYYCYVYNTTVAGYASITLKPGVEFYGDTIHTYSFRPDSVLRYNTWNGKDTTVTEGNTLTLSDINGNALSYEWRLDGKYLSDSKEIAISKAGHYTLRVSNAIYGDIGHVITNEINVSFSKLTAAFEVIADPCIKDKIDLKFSGSYLPSDTIVSYRWVINESNRYTGKNLIGKELFWEGENTILLSVRTASGDTASVYKVIDVPPMWFISSNVNYYGCGDSALITSTVNTTDHYNLTWSTGQSGKQIMVKESGRYIATLTDDCGNVRHIDSIYVDLEQVSAIPTINYIAGYLVTGQYGGYTNHWYRNDTLIATGSSIFLTTPGVYTVDKVGATCTKISAPYYNYSGLTINVKVVSDACGPQSGTLYGTIVYIPADDKVVGEIYDYGDGTIHTQGGLFHYYEQPGNYTITYTVITASGAKAVVSKDITVQQPPAIRLEIHRGTQDTIMAYPVNFDYAHYQQMQWMNEAKVLEGANAWYFIPTTDGYYTITSGVYNCSFVPSVYYSSATAKTIVVVPAANADSLRMEANFRGTVFNADNAFTIQLSTDNGNARTLTAGEVITLGTVKGTDPTKLAVAIPDSLACASNYVIRVVSSSPADITTWSGAFAITNQPSQPVITQVGDSLFTNSSYDLQWYKDDVAISGTTATAIRAKANGVYKVAALNGTCSALSEARSVVVTAVTDVTLDGNKVTAFPNPSEGKVYLKFATPLTEKVLVKVVNVSGVTVYSTTTIQQQTLLELSSLPKGLYLVEVTGKGTRKVLTIILQ